MQEARWFWKLKGQNNPEGEKEKIVDTRHFQPVTCGVTSRRELTQPQLVILILKVFNHKKKSKLCVQMLSVVHGCQRLCLFSNLNCTDKGNVATGTHRHKPAAEHHCSPYGCKFVAVSLGTLQSFSHLYVLCIDRVG